MKNAEQRLHMRDFEQGCQDLCDWSSLMTTNEGETKVDWLT